MRGVVTVGNGVEVELAVARGDTYLHKARFRPSAILTVGSNPMTTVTLDGSDIPDFLEFLNVTPEGAVLRFAQDTSVEVLSGSQVLGTKALVDGGYARQTGEAFSVNLEVGGKAVVRMGDYKLMLKVEPTSGSEVFTVKAESMDAAPCGKCGTNLRLILAGGGALTPCNACGALNQVSLAGTRQQQFEEQATRIAMPTGVLGGEQPPAAGGADQIDPHSSTGRAVGDLPTFDAISVLKDGDAPAGAAEAIQDLGLADADKQGGVANLAAPDGAASTEPVASPDSVDPGSTTGRAASDLPTFDAIAVLKDDAPDQPKPGTVNLADPGAEATPPPAPEPPPEPAPEPAPQPATPEPAPQEAVAAAQPEPAPMEPAPAAAPAEQPAPAQEAPVSTPPEQSPPVAPEPEPAPAPSSDGEYSPSTGQWEETLTIQAVKPKGKSILPWVILMVVAVLGILGLAALVVVFKFVL